MKRPLIKTSSKNDCFIYDYKTNIFSFIPHKLNLLLLLLLCYIYREKFFPNTQKTDFNQNLGIVF